MNEVTQSISRNLSTRKFSRFLFSLSAILFTALSFSNSANAQATPTIQSVFGDKVSEVNIPNGTTGPFWVYGMVYDANGVHWGGRTLSVGFQRRGDPVISDTILTNGVLGAPVTQTLLQDLERSSGQNYAIGFGGAYPYNDGTGLAWLVQSARIATQLTTITGASYEILKNGIYQQLPMAYASGTGMNTWITSEIPITNEGPSTYFSGGQWHAFEIPSSGPPDGYPVAYSSVNFQGSVWTGGVGFDYDYQSVGQIWKDQNVIPIIHPSGLRVDEFNRLSVYNGSLYGTAIVVTQTGFISYLVRFEPSATSITYAVLNTLSSDSYGADFESIGSNLLVVENKLFGGDYVSNSPTFSSVQVAGTSTAFTGADIIGGSGIVNQIAAGPNGSTVIQAYNLDGTIKLISYQQQSGTVDPATIAGLPAVGNTPATVTWGAVTGATSYNVTVTISGSTTVAKQGSPTTASFALPQGLPAGLYDIDIEVLKNGARVGGTSTKKSFSVTLQTVNSATFAGLPSLADTAATITWGAISNATSYELLITNAGSSTIVKQGAANTTSYALPQGLPAGLYEISGRALGAANTPSGAWSTKKAFTVALKPVDVSTIIGLPTLGNTAATISWGAVTAASTYEVLITNAGTTTVVKQATVATNSYSLPQGLPAGLYEFSVRALAVGNSSAWSEKKAFTAQLQTVDLASVLGFPTLSNTAGTITWAPIAGAATYEILILKAGTTTVVSQGTSTTSSYLLASGLPAGAYEISLRALATGLAGAWTGKKAFSVTLQTVNPATIAGLPLVANIATTVTWTAVTGATSYELQITKAGSTTVVRQGIVTTTSYALPQGLLAGSYEISLRAIGANTSAWSTKKAFTVVPATVTNTSVTGFPGVANTPATITWGTVAGATGYEVLINSAGTTTVVRQGTVTTNSYALSQGLPAGFYEFSVRALGDGGTSGSWSTKLPFTVILQTVNIASLTGLPTLANTPTTLTFAAVTGATGYEVLITKSGTTTVVKQGTTNTTSYALPQGLVAGPYDISLRALGVAGTNSSWTAKRAFVVLLPTVNIATLTGLPTLANTVANLTFGGVTGATSYEVLITVAGTTTVVKQGTVNGTSYLLAQGLPAGLYEISIRALATGASGAWSTKKAFTVGLPTINIATLAGLPTIANTAATLTFAGVNGATSYEVLITKAGTATVVKQGTVTTASYPLPQGLPAGLYEVSVRGLATGVAGAWSTKKAFTVNLQTVNSATFLGFPTIANTAATLTFGAITGATSYEVLITKAGTNTVVKQGTVASASYSLAQGLPAGLYEVSARALATGVNGVWSSKKAFTVNLQTVNSATFAGLPTVADTARTLTFGAIAGATSYEVLITKAGTNTVVKQGTVNSTSYVLPQGLPAGVYEVSARALASGVNGAWSAKMAFTVVLQAVNLATIVGLPTKSDTRATITWGAVVGATSYEVLIKKAGITTVVKQGIVTTTSYALPQGLVAGSYQINIRAVATGLTGAWSADKVFVVVGPQLALTYTNATNTLSWPAAGSFYEVEVRNTSGIVKVSTVITATTYKIVLAKGTYVARVRALDASKVAITEWPLYKAVVVA